MKLVRATETPMDLSIAAARTCYSSSGPVLPEKVSHTEKAKDLRDRIARSTLKAGHLTTRQHVHFVFLLEGVSRHAVWSFFHNHPHYNSEQVSQRYVPVQSDQFYHPPGLQIDSEAKRIYDSIIQKASAFYDELTETLLEPAASEYFARFPGRSRNPEKWNGAIRKRAMEAARYVLPVSTTCYMYHTIDALTLHRYAKMRRISDIPEEVSAIVEAMLEEVRKLDTDFAAEFPEAMDPKDAPEIAQIQIDRKGAKEFNHVFDFSLDHKISVPVGNHDMAATVLDDSLRAIYGKPGNSLSRKESIEALFTHEENPYLSSLLNEGIHSRQMSVLSHVNLTYRKKISHTADSQDQRHRVVYGSRPFPITQYSGIPDYITPLLIESHSPSQELYRRAMEEIFSGIEEFLQAGGTEKYAVYLFPNAFPIRFYETGNLAALRHKWMARSCYNAQEEIFGATLDEIRAVEENIPFLKGIFRAPCHARYKKGITPYCPEGDRFCGVRVWELDLPGYDRIL